MEDIIEKLKFALTNYAILYHINTMTGVVEFIQCDLCSKTLETNLSGHDPDCLLHGYTSPEEKLIVV